MRIRRDAGLGAAKAAETWTATGPKLMFREAYERRRCIVPIDGFFELSPQMRRLRQQFR